VWRTNRGYSVAKKTKRTIAKFVDVSPMFVSLVSNPASKRYFTDVLRSEDLTHAEGMAGVVYRSDEPGVAEAIAFLRDGKAGVVQVGGVERSARRLVMPIVRIDREKRTVYGSAYCPPLDVQAGADITRAELDEKVDTYGTFMDSETLETLAHTYMEVSRGVDVMHSFKAVGAVPVESTIIREGETTEDYPHVGMWKLGVKVNDDAVWARVDSGELNSYSIAVMAAFESMDVFVVDDEAGEATASARSADEPAEIPAPDASPEPPPAPAVKRTCVAFQDLPIAPEDTAWDGAAADQRLRELCSDDGSGDADKMDWEAYTRGFLWVDEAAPENFGSYKLGVADVVDGELLAVPAGISAAAGRLNQIEISEEDQAMCQAHLGNYYVKMGKPAPWEGSADRGVAPTPAEEPAAPAPVADDVPAPAARGKFMDEVNEKLVTAEPMNRLWLAMYALEDFLTDHLWSWDGEYTTEDVGVAFDECRAFVLEQLAMLDGLRDADAKTTLAHAMLEARYTLAERVGKKIAKARLDKIDQAKRLLDEVIADATDIVEESAGPAAIDAPAPAPAVDPATPADPLAAVRGDLAGLIERVAKVEGFSTRLDELVARMDAMPTGEVLMKLREDLDDIMEDLGLATPENRQAEAEDGTPQTREEKKAVIRGADFGRFCRR